VTEAKSDVLYIVAEAFRENLSQFLGQELHIVAQFDGDRFLVTCSKVLFMTAT